MFNSKYVLIMTLWMMSSWSVLANDVQVNHLLKEPSAVAANTEVIVSRVDIPANTTLPKHWHHGEEYVHILSGTVTLWQQGKENHLMKAGDTLKIPLKQIHTAITGDEAVSIMVFRVHEQGKPVRVNVD
ncbi:cupin domain-containing protein [Pseudoalteromonas sp. SSDWG2]|uniref:cupin domain-containing protein n=1 Tax=Pseudoalteromonas sp. SSDWG2 TaxID=3139391 RepID=UPI003BA92180